MIQSYLHARHWYNLILDFEAKVVYYFEPFGSVLLAGNPVLRAINVRITMPHQGWRVKSIDIAVQTDGHSCGLWSLVLTSAWHEYIAHQERSEMDFKDDFLQWLDDQGVCNLNSRRRGTAKARERCGNETYIAAVRQDLRDKLKAEAIAGTLRYKI